MSWGIYLAGAPVDIKAKIAQDTNAPEEVKSLASRMVDAVAPGEVGETVIATVNTSGHFDQYGGSGTIEVKRLVLLPVTAPNEGVQQSPAQPS